MIEYFVVKVVMFAVIATGGVVAAIRQATRRSRVRAQLRAAPSEFADNAEIAFRGTVKLIGEPLEAPLSGTPCVGYRAVARVYQPKRSPRGPRKLASEVVLLEIAPFVLVTKDGDIYVESSAPARLLLPAAPIIPHKLALEQRFLDRAEVAAQASDAGFDEARIDIGMKLVVHGIARSEVDPSPTAAETGFREAPMRICVSGDAEHPLTIDAA